MVPKKPNSSPINVKIKSVCFSGKYSKYDWLPCKKPFPKNPPEPRAIFEKIVSSLIKKNNIIDSLKNISVIITTGPTIENIDPVRHISNKSSGKQGFAIASELSKRGAKVTVISGPVEIPIPDCLKIINVTSAQEMFEKTISQLPADVVICAAAVSDWRLVLEKTKINVNNKIKKSNKSLHFTTVENPDIIAAVVKSKFKPKLVIGFSAETENVIQNSKTKIKEKYCDLIVANDVSKKDSGFNSDYNKVSIIDKKGKIKSIPKNKKSYIANTIAKIILDKLLMNDRNIN